MESRLPCLNIPLYGPRVDQAAAAPLPKLPYTGVVQFCLRRELPYTRVVQLCLRRELPYTGVVQLCLRRKLPVPGTKRGAILCGEY